MSWFRWSWPILCAVLWCPLVAGASNSAVDVEDQRPRLFLDAVAAYQDGDPALAMEGFEALVSDGVHNGKLYYNLGNAQMKAGDLGRAVLWYERAALLLGPSDPELRFNREYARSLVVDEVPENGIPWGRVLLFWRSTVSRSALMIAAVTVNGVLWLLLAAYRLRRRRALRRWARATAGVLALLLLTVAYDAYAARRAAGGVILPAEVAVRSGTSADTTELFRLHAGTLVQVERQQDGYARIRFGADAIGWVSAKQVGLIRPRDVTTAM